MTATLDWLQTNVCISPALTTDDDGLLKLQPYAVPRLVVDELAQGSEGKVYESQSLPGKLLIEKRVEWYNDTPLEHMVRIMVSRSDRAWITSNPNAVEIRDLWTRAIDAEPSVPVVTGLYNGACGSSVDIGTNTVSEPLPGRHWVWEAGHLSDEYMGPVEPGSTLKVWYRAYVWTPPPWSNNANNSAPQHWASAKHSRISLMVFPRVELPRGL